MMKDISEYDNNNNKKGHKINGKTVYLYKTPRLAWLGWENVG